MAPCRTWLSWSPEQVIYSRSFNNFIQNSALYEPCSNTQQDSPGMSLQPLAGPEESGWEWDWDWQQQQGRERGPSPPSYGAPPPAPASPWPVDALAPPRPSSCPPPPSAWRCSRSGPWCFLCCCRLSSGESEDKEMSSHVALNSDGNTADVHKLTSLHRFGFLVRGGRLRHVIKGPGTLSTPETKTWESSPHHFTHSNTRNTPYLIHAIILDSKFPSKSFRIIW